MSMVSPDLVAVLRAQLSQGERVAWAQGPSPDALEPAAPRRKGIWDAVVILGGGYATLGSIWMALRSGGWYWLALPIALILLGVAAYFIDQASDERKRRAVLGTVYAVTTRRVLILRTYPKVAMQAIEIDAIADVTLANEREDFADLQFLRKEAGAALVFPGIAEAKRALSQVLRVVRDTAAVDSELAHSEAYLKAMRGMMKPAS